MIACLDVHYPARGARAACVLIERWDDAAPAATSTEEISDVAPYEPGRFYLRELPCLLAVLATLPALPEVVVVDGYVWLSPEHGVGLGAHLHEALAGRVPVIGAAKTSYRALAGSPLMVPVTRGASRAPLYVTAVGIAAEEAARCVRGMHGAHRIPTILALADRLARGGV